MSGSAKKLLHAAAGTAAASGGATYVENVFSTFLYGGNNTNGTEIVNGIDLDDKGGMVWLKNRSSTFAHFLFNTTSSAAYHYLSTDSTNGVNTSSSDTLVDFNDDGFTLDDDNSYVGGMNVSGTNYVSWTFAKQEGFFDIVTYTGDGTSARTISHSLGCLPGMILVKRTDSTDDWQVWHRYTDLTYSVAHLNTTAAFTNTGGDNAAFADAYGNATNFTLGAGSRLDDTNADTATYIAYLFAGQNDSDSQKFGDDSDESIIKCGKFSTDGSGNTSLVSCGWEPGWLITKRRDGTSNWTMMDNMRDFSQMRFAPLYADATNAETADVNDRVVPRATGFQGTGGQFSANAEYVFMAIRRGPMKEPDTNTKVYSNTRGGGSAADPHFVGTNLVDLALTYYIPSSGWRFISSRPYNGHYQASHRLEIPAASGKHVFDHMIGWNDGDDDASDYYSEMFSRWPKVFDIVSYTGAGAGNHSHNLGVVPEMMIIKCTSDSNRWIVYHKDMGNTKQLHWDEDIAETTGQFNDTTPTSSVFSVSDNTQSGTSTRLYSNFLFASLDGISAVGSYTGTGSSHNVTTLGATARFVMIKRTDAVASWIVFSSGTGMGIVAGNDTYLEWEDESAAVTTGTDYIDTHASGFTINGSDGALNASSGEYIYLAFA